MSYNVEFCFWLSVFLLVIAVTLISELWGWGKNPVLPPPFKDDRDSIRKFHSIHKK